nr:hypothetical protein [Lactobacillus johnsonii]
MVPNEHYYKGKPHLKKITASVITPASVAQSIKSNKFDVTQVSNSQCQILRVLKSKLHR